MRIAVSRNTLLVILILAIIALIEGLFLFGAFISSLGTGEFSVLSLPFSWNTKFQYAPLILLDWLKVPSANAIGLLLIFYHFIGGFFAYLFARAYMGEHSESKEKFPMIPLMAGIVYMMFPWNTFGDNFPTLVLVRALAPLVLLLFLTSLRSGILRYSILGGLVLGVMTVADPRSIIFLIPISFLIITIPELSVKSTTVGRAVKVNLVFMATSFIASLVEIIYRIPGVAAGGTGASTSSPAASINLDAFVPNFTHATPIHYLAGISFEATYQNFVGLLSGVPGLSLVAVFFGLMFTLTLAYYCLFILPPGDDRRRALFVLGTIAVVTLLFTVYIPGDRLPLVYYWLLGSDVVRESSLLSTLMIMFRTMRFPNMLLMLSLVPLFTIVMKDLLPRWSSIKALIREKGVLPRGGWRGVLNDKEWKKTVALALTFVLVFSGMGAWLIPQVVRGQGMAFIGGITFETTAESRELSEVIAMINEDPTVERILAIQPVNNNLPNMYMYQDIEGGVSQYMVHYAVDTLYSPIIRNGDYDFLASLLAVMGVGYVVVNGHMIDSYYGGEYGERMVQTPSFSTIVSELEASERFIKVAEKGKVVAFKTATTSSSVQGMYVLGGLEDFRKAYPYLSEATGSDILPLMLDSYFDIDDLSGLPDYPILIGAHKTMDDLTASLAILNYTGTVLAPSQWIGKQWKPHENWSPGYIQDKIGGGWSPIILDITNYEWSFSGTPDIGYAYVEGAYDTISRQVDLEDQEYVILARVLNSPEGGELRIQIQNNNYILDTQWDNESSEFLWTMLGTMSLNSSTEIKLSSRGGINAVNSILVVPKADWEHLTEISSKFLEDRAVVHLLDPDQMYLNGTTGTSSTSFNILKNGNYSVVFEGNSQVSIGQIGNLTDGQTIDLDQGPHHLVFSNYLSTIYSEDFPTSTKIRIRGNSPWSPNNLWFKWRIDNETWTAGGSSLNITTGLSNDSLWSDVRGPVIPVVPGRECVISLDMKCYNAHQSHVVVNGVREDGSQYRLTMVMHGQDGTLNWTRFSTTFMVPEGTIGIRLLLNAGAVYNSLIPTTTTWFDNITVKQAANDSSPLVLVQDNTDGAGPQIAGPEVSVIGGFINAYKFTISEDGTGITFVPETFYGSSFRIASNGPQVQALPVYCTYLGLVVSSENGSSGTVVVDNPLRILIGQMSEVAFLSILVLGTVIALSLYVGPWRLKVGEKTYATGRE